MFLGHFAVSLGAKKPAPSLSLGTLFLAAQFVDLLWPLFLLLGIEHARIDVGNTAVTPLDFYDYPFTHSLAGAILWSCVLALLYYALKHNVRNALIIGAAVASHWVLDFLTHRPDLPLWFSGGPHFGLGLWNSMVGTVVVEVGLFLLGLFLYLRTTTAKDKIGSIGFWTLVGFLGLIYLGNLAGPPPPDVPSIAVVGNSMWLLVLWAYWVDRHRTVLDAVRKS
ncbi:MAG TPA: hypothetical protein DEP53_17525 [Bacteroidetes bacterium]|nr:hypothetical protein [Bacteroidota bacterium]